MKESINILVFCILMIIGICVSAINIDYYILYLTIVSVIYSKPIINTLKTILDNRESK